MREFILLFTIFGNTTGQSVESVESGTDDGFEGEAFDDLDGFEDEAFDDLENFVDGLATSTMTSTTISISANATSSVTKTTEPTINTNKTTTTGTNDTTTDASQNTTLKIISIPSYIKDEIDDHQRK